MGSQIVVFCGCHLVCSTYFDPNIQRHQNCFLLIDAFDFENPSKISACWILSLGKCGIVWISLAQRLIFLVLARFNKRSVDWGMCLLITISSPVILLLLPIISFFLTLSCQTHYLLFPVMFKSPVALKPIFFLFLFNSWIIYSSVPTY